MRRFLTISLVCVLALAIAMPVFALEVKWGGLFRARVLSQHSFTNYPLSGAYDLAGTEKFKDDPNDPNSGKRKGVPYTQHNNRFDQRLRIFIDFISSENLKVVTKFETNAVWGSAGSGKVTDGKAFFNSSGSGNVGADSGNLVVKNVYVDFKIPQTPLSAKVGIQGINLVDSWIVDDDFSAAVLTAHLKPFTVMLGYIAGQNFTTSEESENIDDLVAMVEYKEGPFKAALIGLWQDAHNTPASVFPTQMDTPVTSNVYDSSYYDSKTGYMYNQKNPFGGLSPYRVENNQLFDLGLQLGYKIDYLSAYLNFVKNFGSAKLGYDIADLKSADYTGWMADAGVNYFCGPWSANLGGFYTTGSKVTQNEKGELSLDTDDLKSFTYPLATSKYFSEIMGGGILDNTAPNGGYWRGYPFPTNLWTVTVGGAWQAMPSTKLALSYWYFGTSEKVPSRWNGANWDFSRDLGHEINLNITQNIVDKLNLDLVGAYMFTGDGYRAKDSRADYTGDDNVYELGARLQWTW